MPWHSWAAKEITFKSTNVHTLLVRFFQGNQCEFLQQHGNGREPSEVVFLNIAPKFEVLQRFSFSQTKIHINGKRKCRIQRPEVDRFLL